MGGPDAAQQGWISEGAVLAALARQFRCDVPEVPGECLDSTLVNRVPVDYARQRGLLTSAGRAGWQCSPAIPSPPSPGTSCPLLLGVEPVSRADLRPPRHRAAPGPAISGAPAAAGVIDSIAPSAADAPAAAAHDSDLLRAPDSAPVTRLVNAILLEALKAGASDIHIEPYDRSLHVRYRVDGVLYEQAAPPKHLEAALVSRLKIMARMDIAERRLPQDGMARVRVGEREIDVRVSSVPVGDGERIVLRLLRHDTALVPLADLGMGEDVLTRFRALLREPHGVVWVTGPTGSGKTTTLYAALREFDTRGINILTIEDPVEYQLDGIGQIAVKDKIGLTFAIGLRHILRQDPDVVLVGETRDTETAEIVVRASLTGHLVFSTLHTNDALSAVTRLVDMGIEPFLVAEATRGCMAQRLVRRLCPACRTPVRLTEDRAAEWGPAAAALAGSTVYEPNGCPECRNGFQGRLGIYELVVLDSALRDAVRNRAGTTELRRIANTRGARWLLDDGLAKVAAGLTSLSELSHALGRLDAGA
ncbi:MAG: ATPase, T2SS/T4P/T4SS family [Kiritimatiellia bacterium]